MPVRSTWPPWSDTPALEKNVAPLMEAISRAKEATGQSKVIIVAHSMGGLVTRAYLENDDRYEGDVEQVFTFGTPHTGTPVATLGAVLATVGLGAFGCGALQTGVCEMSEPGMLAWNLIYDTRAPGVDYHLVGGDAPYTKPKKICVLGWPVCCWR